MSHLHSTLPATFVHGFHDEELCKRMQYSFLGTTALQVSKISFGGASLTTIYGDEGEASATLHKALKLGINYIDTAPWYGQGRSEELLGRALKSVPRSAYYIATKVGRYELDYKNMFDFSAKKTRESVETSLKLLGLDYVDVIQIHDIEFAKNLDIVVKECLPELEKLVGEGKAKYIGLTGYDLDFLEKCIKMAPGKFQVVLSYARYTLMDNSLKNYLPFFQNEKLGIVCASGHALGLLTNAGPQSWHPATNEQKLLTRKAATICKEANIELGKLAMYYFLQLDGVTTFLTGMQTRHLLDINMSAFYYGLNHREQEVLQLLQDTIFTQPCNWEGIELEHYWSAMNEA